MAIVNEAIIDQGGGDYRHIMLTVPASKSYAITNILICNTYDPNASAPENETCEFDLHFVPASGSYSDTVTSVVRRLSLPAGETFTLDTEKVVLDAGDSVQVNGGPSASGTGRLACTVSYLDIT